MNCSCGCCVGPHIETPGSTANRPGLSRLAYRAGTHATFVQTMQARLSSGTFAALEALHSRDRNDASIALLDAWAITGDVLTFYQERIVNEGYLRTATERRSVLELARLIGYTPKPGVAASVYLAYMVEKDAPPVEIPAGARANSVPAPGEQMQAFETSEPLKARFEWNVMRPRLTRPQVPSDRTRWLYFAGVATNLKPNDSLLLWFDRQGPPKLRRVKEVTVDAANDRTHVLLQGEPGKPHVLPAIKTLGQIIEKSSNLETFGVSGTTVTAKQVLNVLNEISAQANASADLAEHLETVALPQLEELLRFSQKYNSSKLVPWIEGIVGELRDAHGALVSEPGLESTFEAAAGSNTVSALGGVMTSIAVAPSKTPASARQLPRDADRVLASSADALPRLVTALRPELGALYTAWGNLPLSRDAGVSVCALRVQAPPFGHNAPLRPVLDNNQRPIRNEEWPLSNFVTTTITFVMREANPVLVAAKIDQGAISATVENTPLQESTNTYKLVLGALTTVTMTVDYGNTAMVKTVKMEASGFSWTVALNFKAPNQIVVESDGQGKDVQNGESAELRLDETRITVDWNLKKQGAPAANLPQDGRITVTVEHILADTIELDARYEKILPQSWAVIERADTGASIVAQIAGVRSISRADYGISGRITQLLLDPKLRPKWLTLDDRWLSVFRATTVLAQCESLALAEEAIDLPLCGQEIELGALYDGLEPGRWVIVAGERADIRDAQGNIVGGVKAAELQMISGVEQKPAPDRPGDKAHTFITFFDKLAYCYRLDTVAIYGNVVKATHGETRQEVLGAGNAAVALQQFTLRQPPLTFVSAPAVSGVQSTLVVRVNDVQWHESGRFSELGPTDHRFITRTDDDAKTTVVFGDGEFGARLPTGLENVKATYRNGLGKPGNVKAGQITLLSTRPLGVKEVINPIRASGGADRENRDQMRKNAPLALLALDRLVSTVDYADFARTFAGIGKATASRKPTAHASVVQVTVAGADDAPIEVSSDLYRNLDDALHRFGDPYLPIELVLRKRLTLIMAANVEIDPDYQWETLEPKIRAALVDRFSFDNQELGQHVFLSSAMAAVQAVRGVTYVDFDKFDARPEDELVDAFKDTKAITIALQPRIAVKPDEIAYLVPDVPETLILQELKP